MRTTYDEWTKLKKVLIGKSFKVTDLLENTTLKILLDYENEVNLRYNKYLKNPTNHVRTTAESLFDIFDIPSVNALKKVHDETNEDLEALANICKTFGAEVVRPNLKYGIERQLEHPMQCRDTVGKIGNTIFEINTASHNRRIENFNHREVLIDEFQQGARYIAMPPVMTEIAEDWDNSIDDIESRNTTANKTIKIYNKSREFIGDTAAFYKCGKHIFHTHAKPNEPLDINEHSKIRITENGLEWWKREFSEHEFLPLHAYGHVDGKFAILRPGLVITWHEKYVPQIMKDNNWDIVLIEESANFTGKTIKELCEERGLKNKYPLEHLLGVSQETRFDCNVLSLDENTIVTSGYDKALADKLKKYNIDMIPWVNRWNVLWSGGAHCCSVDLEREGELINYFS